MGKIKLLTVERKTSVSREAVRAAVQEAFKDYKKFKPKNEGKTPVKNHQNAA